MFDRRSFLSGGAVTCFMTKELNAMADVSPFKKVTKETFQTSLEAAGSSERFRSVYPRYRRSIFEDHEETDYRIHVGDLTHRGSLQIPAYKALVLGNVAIEFLCDLTNPTGFDEGGAFIVIGNVTCRSFANLSGGKIAFIDGNLIATDAILNDAEDSSLLVTGDVHTKWYQGIDIWVEVGGRVDMDYGDGYALPLGQRGGENQTDPRHDVTTSMKALSPDVDKNPEASA